MLANSSMAVDWLRSVPEGDSTRHPHFLDILLGTRHTALQLHFPRFRASSRQPGRLWPALWIAQYEVVAVVGLVSNADLETDSACCRICPRTRSMCWATLCWTTYAACSSGCTPCFNTSAPGAQASLWSGFRKRGRSHGAFPFEFPMMFRAIVNIS
jgi:hypothetical protein